MSLPAPCGRIGLALFVCGFTVGVELKLASVVD
jgi:hypothetical protein